jgi:hypothetical protein
MALDPYALSTVDSLQAYANLQGCGVSVPQIEALINAASAWIERVAARKFKARDYVQWYNGQWQEQLQLDQYPVGYVKRIAYGNSIALNIQYSGSAVQATVATTTTGIILNQVAAAGTTTTNTLSMVTYPTWSTMAAAISLLPGFSATVGNVDGPSDELAPGIYCQFNNNAGSIYLFYPSFDQPTRFVNRDAGIVGFPGSGWAPWGNSTPAWGNDVIYPAGAFIPAGFQGLMVKYRAGYEVVPFDIEMLTNEVAAFMYYQGQSNPTMKSENIGDYSYTRQSSQEMLTVFSERVKQFASLSIGGA